MIKCIILALGAVLCALIYAFYDEPKRKLYGLAMEGLNRRR